MKRLVQNHRVRLVGLDVDCVGAGVKAWRARRDKHYLGQIAGRFEHFADLTSKNLLVTCTVESHVLQDAQEAFVGVLWAAIAAWVAVAFSRCFFQRLHSAGFGFFGCACFAGTCIEHVRVFDERV